MLESRLIKKSRKQSRTWEIAEQNYGLAKSQHRYFLLTVPASTAVKQPKGSPQKRAADRYLVAKYLEITGWVHKKSKKD